MPPSSPPPLWAPALAGFIFFVCIWLAVTSLLAWLSGWRALARGFAADSEPEGKVFRRQVVYMGRISENGATCLIVAQRGLYLYAFVLFRAFRPPLLIPWEKVRLAGERRLWRWTAYELDLGAVSTVRVKQQAYDAIRRHLPPESPATGLSAPPSPPGSRRTRG
ncbi:MAG: hypothetical protein M3O15_14660 [Acidobacteriota bacterium]|nr:hypothetical protein [Acidobacteriota bacterium]